jgi:hypothetical protein
MPLQETRAENQLPDDGLRLASFHHPDGLRREMLN